MIPLRLYQSEAIDRVRSRVAAGIRRLVLVLATGGGKTVVAAHIIASAIARDTHVLFAAHRRELIKQAWVKLVRNGIDPAQIGVVMAGVSAGPARGPLDLSVSDAELWARHARRRPNAMVTVASIDSVRNRAKPRAELVIVDECHRARAKSYVDLLASYPDAVVLGLTATPYRADNRGLGEEVDGLNGPLFEDIVVVASPRSLVADGFLVEPRVWTVPDSALPDISRVKVKGTDYDPEALNAAVDRDGLIGNVVEHWQRRAMGVRTVAFPVSIQHSHHVVERFRSAGVAAEHLDGTTPTAERDAILARLESGETLVVSSVGVLCEGWDQPSVKCCALLRPSKSTGLYLQMAGRILRPWHGQEAIILDHAGLTLDHGFVTQDREFSLDSKGNSGISAAPCRSCPECWAVLPASARECSGCGHIFATDAGRGLPDERDGELVEVVAPSESELKADWQAITEECLKGGYRPNWCFVRWGERHPGTRPPAGSKPPTDEECDARKNKRAEILDGYVMTAIERGYKIAWAKNSFKARDGTWPSLDLFLKTSASEWVRTALAALGEVLRISRMRGEPRAPTMSVPVPVAPANDLVEYDIGA